MEDEKYYVYVYIDPRNFEEFYYGKGKGQRMKAHLSDESDSKKTKIIQAIAKEGLQPIIKVIARGLTEKEAFLVEKTLIWKLGRNLSNISSGHFKDKFRPHDTFHLDLNKFDYEKGLYYVNVGHGKTRSWEDCAQFGFLAAGQGVQWSEPLKTLNPGDVIVAYVRGKGYVGIGKVLERAIKAIDFKVGDKALKDIALSNPNIFNNSENEKADYLVKVQWIKKVKLDNAKWSRKSGLFTIQKIKASLERQPKTILFLEKEFDVNFHNLLNR